MGMKLDALNRRNRFAGRQPTGKRIVLSPRDLALFAAMERHGPLPSTFLFEFAKEHAHNVKGHLTRLTDLYNEGNTDHYGPYLHRPEGQLASLNARYQPMTYALTERGARALREHGIPKQTWQAPTGPFAHQLMTACTTASIELAARGKGLRYLSQHDIFTHPKCSVPKGTTKPLSLQTPNGTIIPDQLFGLDYGGSYRFFALEADRQTETLVSGKPSVKAFQTKLERYAYVLLNEAYKRTWGIPQLYIMTVTTSEARMQAMLGLVRRLPTELQGRFLFRVEECWGRYWRVPQVHTSAGFKVCKRSNGAFHFVENVQS